MPKYTEVEMEAERKYYRSQIVNVIILCFSAFAVWVSFFPPAKSPPAEQITPTTSPR